jgi:hypothetical protein
MKHRQPWCCGNSLITKPEGFTWEDVYLGTSTANNYQAPASKGPLQLQAALQNNMLQRVTAFSME